AGGGSHSALTRPGGATRRRYDPCRRRGVAGTATLAVVPPTARSAAGDLHHLLEQQIRELTSTLVAFRLSTERARRAGLLSPADVAGDAERVRSTRATLAAAWRAWLRRSVPVDR